MSQGTVLAQPHGECMTHAHEIHHVKLYHASMHIAIPCSDGILHFNTGQFSMGMSSRTGISGKTTSAHSVEPDQKCCL